MCGRCAAAYLGVGPKKLRKRVRCIPDTDLFDPDDRQDCALSRARTPAEGALVLLRRLRWEARELERHPLPTRMELMNVFEPIWEHLASRFAAAGLRPAAESMWAILQAVRVRLRRELKAAGISGWWS